MRIPDADGQAANMAYMDRENRFRHHEDGEKKKQDILMQSGGVI